MYLLAPQNKGIVLGMSGAGTGTNVTGTLTASYQAGTVIGIDAWTNQTFHAALKLGGTATHLFLKFLATYIPAGTDSDFKEVPIVGYSQVLAGYGSEFDYTTANATGIASGISDVITFAEFKLASAITVYAKCTTATTSASDFVKVGMMVG